MATKHRRESISKRVRFEVFKRDCFTCQYCGTKAPDVLLELDHVRPVADGGRADILNLTTACVDCNSGKGARLLADNSVVVRQRAQLEILQERRLQLEMVLAWRDELERQTLDTVDEVCARICARCGLAASDGLRVLIRKWLRKFTLIQVLEAVEESFDHYMKWNGSCPDRRAAITAAMKVPAIAALRLQAVEKPYVPRFAYIQGILRNRFRDHENRFSELETMHLEWGLPLEVLERHAKLADDPNTWWDDMVALAREKARG